MYRGLTGQAGKAAGCLLLAGLLGSATPATAQTAAAAVTPPAPATAGTAVPQAMPLRLKMQTAFNPTLSVIGEAGRQFTATLKAISGGAFAIKILEAGRVASTPDLLDAVVEGSVDAAFTSPTYAAAKQPALALFAGVPFGPSPEEYIAWMYDGEGGRLHRDLYARLGVHALPCGIVGPEAGGWFRNEINTVADLKGLRLRYNGLGGEVIARLGATNVPTPAGELFFKLQQGKLDGAEFSMPSVDRALGFEKLGMIYYFPGWHQPAALVDFYMRKDRWEALDPSRRVQIETACRATVTWTLARQPGEQVRAMEYFRKAGVTVRAWRPDVLEAFRETSAAVIAEQAARDADYRATWESLSAFLDATRSWLKLGRP
jgi:TRAP-type mannitol/chloroaromatic compound transport system substrate-binding protein